MTIPDDGDTDLFTVLSRPSNCYAELEGGSTPLSNLPLALSSKGISLPSALEIRAE